MKRPVILVLMASLLASGSVLAKDASNDAFTRKMAAAVARNNDGNRGHDRGNNHRGNDHRGNDHRGNDRGHDRGHDNRHDNNHRNDNHRDHGNHAPPSHGRAPDNRNDHNRRDWNDHRNDHNRHDYNDNRWDRYRGDWNRHPNYWDNRRHDRADYARYRFRYGSYHAPRGYYYRTWRRGDHLPHGWYGNSYVVYDWRPYRLYSPPYGYHWVRVGNDVLLTAVATGIVLDVIYDIWY